MEKIFRASEIVELGIQIEKNGRDLYDMLANKSKNKKAEEVFKYLEGEETKHIAAFKKILESVESYEPQSAYPEEYFAYMKALASEYIFTKEGKGKAIAQRTKTDKKAVDLGIGFEKDSIIFYEGMKRSVLKDEEKVLDELIRQEEDHLRRLIDLKHDIVS
ncbi:MAG: ferritin family protein [Candidatus Omnitrophica bacterium]|nr:ferritin family protein [Candidatus Omnitrophota bacterium]